MSEDFLKFTKSRGNDLTKPNKTYSFKGLAPGDSWCICASRWNEAKNNGVDMRINLNATNISSFNDTQEFDFTWKKRVIACDKENFNKQFNILSSESKMMKELKLIVIPSSKKGCRLIGLDGSVKVKQKDVFSIESLTSIINNMPMRQSELRSRENK